MASEIENALFKIYDGQKQQTDAFLSVKEDIAEIKESISRVSVRLEAASESTIRSSEKIKFLESSFSQCKSREKNEKDQIWECIRTAKKEAISEAQKNVMLKIYGALFISLTSLFISFSKRLWL